MSEQHVRPNKNAEGGWLITTADASNVRARLTTQGGAVEQAREFLRHEGGGTLIVHSTDGSVREERSAG